MGPEIKGSRLVSFMGVQARCTRLRRMGGKEFDGSVTMGDIMMPIKKNRINFANDIVEKK